MTNYIQTKMFVLEAATRHSVLTNIILSLYCVQMLLNCPCPVKRRPLGGASEFKYKLLSRCDVAEILVLFQQRSPEKCHVITRSSFQRSLAVHMCLH